MRVPFAFVQTIFIILGFLAADGTDFLKLISAIIILGPTLIYGGIYIINDIVDLQFDILHPKKKVRPLITGDLDVNSAGNLAVILLIVGFLAAFLLNRTFFIFSLLILFNNLMYSIFPRLKDNIYSGMISCSINYSLRFLAGASLVRIDWNILLLAILFFAIAMIGFISYRIYDMKTSENEHYIVNEKNLLLLARIFIFISFIMILAISVVRNNLNLISILFSFYLVVFSELNLNISRKGADFFKLLRIWRTYRLQRNLIYYPIMAYILMILAIYFVIGI